MQILQWLWRTVGLYPGAAASEGGKPIIAMPAITAKGISKISPTLLNGAGVVTTRFDVHYVVTEYGVAGPIWKNLTGSR